MTVEFITDVGFRIENGGRSMILQSSTIGKPGQRLSARQIRDMAADIATYHDAVSLRDTLGRRVTNVTPAISGPPPTDFAYKFTSDEGLDYWMAGRLRINPVAIYQTIENDGARDVREGLGFVYLDGPTRNAGLHSISGFNVGLICTSMDARKSERQVRHQKFGKRLIKINRLQEFSNLVAEMSGAARYEIRDVVYSDVKIVKGTSLFPDWFAEVNGIGHLREKTLELIAEKYLDELADKTMAASVYTKPVSYRTERERRLAFVFTRDISEPIDIQSDQLVEHLEILV